MLNLQHDSFNKFTLGLSFTSWGKKKSGQPFHMPIFWLPPKFHV